MKVEIKVPATPNFILVDVAGKEVQVSIADMTDDELSDIAERWRTSLFAEAANKRAMIGALRK